MKQSGRNVKRLLVLAGTGALAVGLLAACAGGSAGHGGTGGQPHPGSLSADQLVGTWVVDATFDTPTTPYLTIIDDGSWRGSDGCNGVQGTWELDESGTLEVTAGPTTQIFCEGKPLPNLFAEAKSAILDDESHILILLDKSGEAAATLIPGREDITPLS